jgi:hypothetical protein
VKEKPSSRGNAGRGLTAHVADRADMIVSDISLDSILRKGAG